MLNAQIAKDQNDFSINEVVRSITDKLIRRHPHVFGDVDAKDTETVLQNWEAIKRSEAGYEDRKSVSMAYQNPYQASCERRKFRTEPPGVGFDWDTVADVLPKLEEEIEEVKVSVKKGDTAEIEMEIGDLLFSVVNLCRFLEVQAEEALRQAVHKFTDRFQKMEGHLNNAVKPSKTTIWLD